MHKRRGRPVWSPSSGRQQVWRRTGRPARGCELGAPARDTRPRAATGKPVCEPHDSTGHPDRVGDDWQACRYPRSCGRDLTLALSRPIQSAGSPLWMASMTSARTRVLPGPSPRGRAASRPRRPKSSFIEHPRAQAEPLPCISARIWFTCAFCAVSTALARPSSRSNLRFSARTSYARNKTPAAVIVAIAAVKSSIGVASTLGFLSDSDSAGDSL